MSEAAPQSCVACRGCLNDHPGTTNLCGHCSTWAREEVRWIQDDSRHGIDSGEIPTKWKYVKDAQWILERLPSEVVLKLVERGRVRQNRLDLINKGDVST